MKTQEFNGILFILVLTLPGFDVKNKLTGILLSPQANTLIYEKWLGWCIIGQMACGAMWHFRIKLNKWHLSCTACFNRIWNNDFKQIFTWFCLSHLSFDCFTDIECMTIICTYYDAVFSWCLRFCWLTSLLGIFV